MSLHASFSYLSVRFLSLFAGVEQFPMLLQAPFVYSEVVFKVTIYIFFKGGSRGRVQGVRPPPPSEMT